MTLNYYCNVYILCVFIYVYILLYIISDLNSIIYYKMDKVRTARLLSMLKGSREQTYNKRLTSAFVWQSLEVSEEEIVDIDDNKVDDFNVKEDGSVRRRFSRNCVLQ